MSANNYILIEETNKGYKITQRDYETERPLGKARWQPTLKSAVLKAQDLRDTDWFPIEYGIVIELVDGSEGK